MQWRWPGRGRWQQARSLHEIRELALAAARHVPLVQIRDGPGDPPGWLLALADDPNGPNFGEAGP